VILSSFSGFLMKLLCLCFLFITALVLGATNALEFDAIAGRTLHLTPRDLSSWLNTPEELLTLGTQQSRRPTAKHVVHLRQQLIKKIHNFAQDYLAKRGASESANDQPYPYFRWLPPYVGSARPGSSSSVEFEGRCFKKISVQAAAMSNSSNAIALTINLEQPVSLLCNEFMLLATVEGLQFERYSALAAGVHQVTYNPGSNLTQAERWDILNNGIRVFNFLDDVLPTIQCVLATVKLFLSELTQHVDPKIAEANLDFLAKYVGVTMPPRSAHDVPLNESLIHSGDFFGMMRLDGVDPMLAWAMGSTTGHVTVAVWIGGQLYICESTAKNSYWDMNGIQKTPYREWLAKVKAADYNVVWLPLSAENRAKFNASAAIESFQQLEGLDYGFHTLLWGWLDTASDNYPCLPPDYKHCMQWEHVEILFGFMDKSLPTVATALFSEALSRRVGSPVDIPMAEILQRAVNNGLDPRTVPTIVERDAWDYRTTRYDNPIVSKSMVCCVFVCNMWKAGGLFKDINDEVECGELTNWDDYATMLFDVTSPRPQQCVDADPDSPLCQINGAYSLTLPQYNTRKMYRNMAQKCPSLAPSYLKPEGC